MIPSKTEAYTKVFLVLPDDTTADGEVSRRQCLICNRIFSRQESYEHSMTICYPPASSMN